ncbi:hypothetical protein V5799_024435 [Amblyomma americanum]|uniref:Uncharacterized protein n=1 Tax=Amblyomma americanum TaxID=6943 RepID=A0AAQ4ECI9_AMBAM
MLATEGAGWAGGGAEACDCAHKSINACGDWTAWLDAEESSDACSQSITGTTSMSATGTTLVSDAWDSEPSRHSSSSKIVSETISCAGQLSCCADMVAACAWLL